MSDNAQNRPDNMDAPGTRASMGEVLDALRHELARLYDRPELAELVVHDVGLPIGEIYFAQAVVRVWSEILEVARKRGRIVELAEYARRDFSNDQRLAAAADDVLEAISSRADAIERMWDGLERLSDDTGANLRAFVDEYLGRDDDPVPFGGRGESMAELDGFLLTEPRCALLRAPAGRGKSALLVRWAQHLISRGEVAVAFVPVSIRFQTASERSFFCALAARLASLHGEELDVERDHPVEWWRGQASRLLDRKLPDGRNLVVIVDGLDEMIGWRPTPATLSVARRPTLRILCSVREQATDTDGAATLRDLGWERPAACVRLGLPMLTADGVAEVLTRMGVPLDQLGAREEILQELWRLTEGDPLLVKLYVEDLWSRRGDVARLHVDDLRGIRVGLDGYFERWWSDQTQAWASVGRYDLGGVARDVLDVCAFAFGPVNREDLSALLNTSDGRELDDAVRDLRRWFAGDVRRGGITFSHPRLAAFFGDQQPQEGRRRIKRRFTEWGRATVQALEQGALSPREAPTYLALHYREHLASAGASPSEFAALLRQSWRDTSIAQTGDLGVFLGDVSAAWACLRDADLESRSRGERERWFGLELRCLLIMTSVVNIEHNVPPEIVARAYELGEWTGEQAVGYLRRQRDRGRPIALAIASGPAPGLAVAGLLLEWVERQDAATIADVTTRLAAVRRTEALQAFVEATSAVGVPRARAVLACAVAARRPPELFPAAFARALEQLENLSARADRAAALALLLPWLPGPLIPALLPVGAGVTSAASRCEAIVDAGPCSARVRRRAEVSAVAPRLPPELVDALIDAAPTADSGHDERIEEHRLRELMWANDGEPWTNRPARHTRVRHGDADGTPHWTRELERLSTQMFEPTMIAMKREIGAMQSSYYSARAYKIPQGDWRAQAISSIYAAPDTGRIRYGHPPEMQALVTELIRHIARHDSLPADVLTLMAPHLSSKTLQFTLGFGLGISEKALKQVIELGSGTTFTLAIYMAECIRERGCLPWTARALSPELVRVAVSLLDDGYYKRDRRGDAAASLAPAVSDPDAHRLLEVARRLDGPGCARVVVALAPRLSPGLLSSALRALSQIKDVRCRSGALVAFARRLSAESVEPFVVLAENLADQSFRAEALAAVAHRLPDARGEEALVTAIKLVRDVPDASSRARTLAAIASSLTRDALRLALVVTHNIGDAAACASAVGALRGEAAREEQRASPPAIPVEVLEARLRAARILDDESRRATELVSLAPQVTRETFRAALAVADTIKNGSAYARAVAALSPAMAPRHLHVVLAHIRNIYEEPDRAAALALLVPRLPPEHLRDAFEVLRGLAGTPEYLQILVGIARRAPLEMYEDLTAAAESLPSQLARGDVVGAILPRMPAGRACEILRSLQWTERAACLRVIQRTVPALSSALGAEALSDALDAVQEVARMWP